MSSVFASPVNTQQIDPFLSTPYFGIKNINSYFDHRYPTYGGYPNSTYSNVVRYDGANLPSCDYVGQSGHICYDGHDGIDFNLYYERVLAAADGVVLKAEWQYPDNRTKEYGLYIDVDHQNGYISRYGHLSAAAVTPGQIVHRGQILGTSGNTGNSTGAHLHFGLFYDGTVVDPFGWSGSGNDLWETYSGASSRWLWSDGQWVGHPILEPQISTSIMLDDNDSGFEKGCQSTPCTYWHYVTGVGTNGGMWWTNVSYEDDYWARWRPTLLLPGFYEVYVFIPNDNATSWQVNYMISHPNGTQSTVVDQQGTSDRWLCLGLYYFDAGSSPFGTISVSDYTGETNLNLKLGIDAVQFRLRSPIFLPLILKNYN